MLKEEKVRQILEQALDGLREPILECRNDNLNFLITDTGGKVLYSASNQRTLPQSCLPGRRWDEATMGHTAVSAAMRTGRLCSVGCSDHDHPRLKEYSSAAAPFRYEGTIYGYFCLVFKGNFAIDIAMVIVRSHVNFIQNQFAIGTAVESLELKAKFEEAIIDSIHDGFMVLAPDLTIIRINQPAAALLDREPAELVGRSLTELVRGPLKVAEIFKTGQGIFDKEFFVNVRNARNKIVHVMKTAVPVHNDQGDVTAVIETLREIKGVRTMVSQMTGAKASFTFDDIVYASDEMAETIQLAKTVAKGPLSVVLQAESGTGKELFAHAIHNASNRRHAPFVIIDCASIPRELMESELFGYVEGAFTGARKGGRPGKFELANEGTVFLDEIGELPIELQAKLLRIIQDRRVVRVGGSDMLPVDIRIIAATNRDLREQVKLGNFREDLFYRLNVMVITIPPLRSRVGDIPLLAEFIVSRYEEKLGKANIKISDAAMEALLRHSWPGNVRELENAIIRAINLCADVILPGHLPPNIPPPAVPKPSPLLYVPLKEVEKSNLLAALQANNGNRVKAAKALGIARSTLYKKLAYYGVDQP